VKLALKVIVPKWSFWGGSMVSMDQQTITAPVYWRMGVVSPGICDRIEPYIESEW
jgi:hypothetical protein